MSTCLVFFSQFFYSLFWEIIHSTTTTTTAKWKIRCLSTLTSHIRSHTKQLNKLMLIICIFFSSSSFIELRHSHILCICVCIRKNCVQRTFIILSFRHAPMKRQQSKRDENTKKTTKNYYCCVRKKEKKTKEKSNNTN